MSESDAKPWSRIKGLNVHHLDAKPNTISHFCFWNSYNDAQASRPPDEYDILSCASSDLYCPSDFEDFCAEYGYDVDSRKAEKTFKACRAQSERLQRIFDTEEMQAELSTIS